MTTCRPVRASLLSPMGILLATILAVGGAAAPIEAQQLDPGVVIDSERGTVYTPAAQGGVEALDLDRGRVLWSTVAGARPLARQGRRLLTQAESHDGRFRLAILDVAARGRVVREAQVLLPAGAAAPIDLPAGVDFRIKARLSGSEILLPWTYVRHPLRGLEPNEEDEEKLEEARVQRFGGVLRADLATGALESVAARAEDEGVRPLPASVAAAADSGAYRQRPLWAGDLVVTTEALELDGQQSLVLRRFAADGTALPAVPLPPGVTLQLASADNRHVLVSRESGDSRPERAHVWTILALPGGQRVGEFSAQVAAAPFVVTNGRVLFVTQPEGRRDGTAWIEEPLQLRAVDLATGQGAWTRALRDTAYRGAWVP